MPRATYAELVNEVRAQVDVDPEQALDWLLDRSRYMNAEAAWNLAWTTVAAAEGQREYPLPPDYVWIEAVIVAGTPYQRSTPHQMDARVTGETGNTLPIYCDGGTDLTYLPDPLFRIDPAPGAGVSAIEIRYVADLADNPTAPPFPQDFDSALVDGAIAIGLARMDERFDSAGYFDARFANAIGRLRRRRHGRIGRGAVGIRVLQ